MSRLLLLLALVAMGGCSYFGAHDIKEELENGSSKRVEIPEKLDSPEFVDIMPIPEINDPRGLVGSDYKVTMPEALSSSFGVDPISIKKLGDDQWIFLDIPPSVVWPKIVQFWEANNLDIKSADPSAGLLESSWLRARDGDAEAVLSSLRQKSVFSNSTNISQHKFRLRLEPGIRSGSSEIYLQHRRLPVGAPFFMGDIDWDKPSDNLKLEGELLKTLAFYLGDNINQTSISMMATGLRESSRAVLIPDSEQPVLKYRLDFNRAWATVGSALENARISVEDLDRTSANYYVYFSTDHDPNPGFFARLFGADGKEEGPANRYTVHLANHEDEGEVKVTVHKDTERVDALVAERLLKVIKEFST